MTSYAPHDADDRADALARQRRLVDSLCAPGCYRHPVNAVKRIDTHISTVLLAGDYAYKIKKALAFPFVDYSTLARRRACCEAEIRLNRRFAPDLYLACVAIHGSPDAPTFDNYGPPIEYAVRMARFAPAAQGDVCARDGRITVEAADSLAATIARYHEEAPARPPDPDYGSAASVIATIRANFEAFESMPDARTASKLAPLKDWIENGIADTAPVLERRHAAGFIRECHGDMHLANLLYQNGRWEAFDGVEFDAALRWIDVMDDMAFTLMDCHAHGLHEPGHWLLNRYLEITGDYSGLSVLRLYLMHRALVRAKVCKLGARADSVSGPRAPRYVDTALALSMARPRLVITHGVSGSGKSWAARRVAEHFGYIRIRSDVERKRLHGLSPLAQADAEPGQGLYDPRAFDATYDRLNTLAHAALRGGWPVILDATFLEPDRRDSAREVARRIGCPFHILDLDVTPETARRRIRARGHADTSDADERVLDRQLAAYRPLESAERDDALTTSGTYSELSALFKGLAGPNPF